ncbi:hypothetical protein SynBIOSE41_01484 [Synechococcus sp. BIOS-E4-1]|nr:hypothetical protein SynBIOSE41_01484 [Synechococcus sp. BIOS-E4-1]
MAAISYMNTNKLTFVFIIFAQVTADRSVFLAKPRFLPTCYNHYYE